MRKKNKQRKEKNLKVRNCRIQETQKRVKSNPKSDLKEISSGEQQKRSRSLKRRRDPMEPSESDDETDDEQIDDDDDEFELSRTASDALPCQRVKPVVWTKNRDENFSPGKLSKK